MKKKTTHVSVSIKFFFFYISIKKGSTIISMQGQRTMNQDGEEDDKMWSERRSQIEMLKLIDIVTGNTDEELANARQRKSDDEEAIRLLEGAKDGKNEMWYLCGDLFLKQTKPEALKSLNVDKWVMEDTISRLGDRKKRLDLKRDEVLRRAAAGEKR